MTTNRGFWLTFWPTHVWFTTCLNNYKVINPSTDLEYEIKNYDLESLVPSSGLEFFVCIDKPLLLLLTPILAFYIISQLECIGFKKNYQAGTALEK